MENFLKEKVSYLKLWTTLLVAMVIGTTAWLVNNRADTSVQFNTLTVMLLVLLITIVAIINRKIYSLIKEMKHIGEKND